MGKKLQKKKRGQAYCPDQSSVYNRPLTRADTIGHRIGDYEPDNSITEHKDNTQILIGQLYKPRRVLTREMIGFLKTNQVQKLVESDDGTSELSNSNLNCASNLSIIDSESENSIKSNNASFPSLSILSGHSFQETFILKHESLVHMQPVDVQEPENEITELAKGANFNMWAPVSANGVKSNNTSFYSLSSLNDHSLQDTCSFKPDSPVNKQLDDARSPETQINELAKGVNFNTRELESEKGLTTMNSYGFMVSLDHGLSTLNSNPYEGTCISQPDFVVHKQLNVSLEPEKHIAEDDKGVNFNMRDPESENVLKSNNSYLHCLSSLNSNPYQDICTFKPHAQVHMRQFHPQGPEKQIIEHATAANFNMWDPESENVVQSNNRYLHDLKSLNGNPYQDIYTFDPHAQGHMRQVDPQDPGKQIIERAKGANFNMWNPESKNVEKSNNSYLHDLSSLNGNPYQDIYTFKPHAQTYFQESEKHITEFAKGFNWNRWMENVIDSVAAVVLPYVP